MTYPESFADKRASDWCALCGGRTGTNDHLPAKVFLDDPLPQNVPGVVACRDCNNGLSKHEDYLACAVEIATVGAVDSEAIRPRVRGILRHSPALAAHFRASMAEVGGSQQLAIEHERVVAVLVKMAKGHALCELNEPQHGDPSSVRYAALHTLSQDERERFETPPQLRLWPEVGSRAMQRMAAEGGLDWVEVQPGRYRFLASAPGHVEVRIVIGEYLAAEVVWQR